jgi:DNA repair protein RadA/Sms
MLEKTIAPQGATKSSPFAILETAKHLAQGSATPVSELLKDFTTSETHARYSSGFAELDQVLGGGILPGAYILLGGDPGIGKSTIMLQLADAVSQSEKTVLYVSGEESPPQLKHRADRLGVNAATLRILPQTNLAVVVQEIQLLLPDLVIIDSIQSLYSQDFSGTPGSVSQIRECASVLMQVAKTLNVTIMLIGHVTKEGVVAGPKLLEHTVDTVLYLEGDSGAGLRLLRSVKNRFGNTNEVGVFEMTALGMAPVASPSEWFLSQRSSQAMPGSAITCTMEGTRPLLLEIQALVAPSAYTAPSRTANGLDKNRLHQVIAILERRVGLDLSRYDVYVNVVGGVRIQETSADLALALALISSLRDLPLSPGFVVCGELGLTGEIRNVTRQDARMAEAAKLGLTRYIGPRPNLGSSKKETPLDVPEGLEILPVETLMDALPLCFNGGSRSPGSLEIAAPTRREKDPAAAAVSI